LKPLTHLSISILLNTTASSFCMWSER